VFYNALVLLKCDLVNSSCGSEGARAAVALFKGSWVISTLINMSRAVYINYGKEGNHFN
jgi:hypothetical protein